MAAIDKRIKRMEILSGVGAGAIGFGLGLLVPSGIGSIGAFVLFVGIAMHAYGMYQKHALQAAEGAELPRWALIVEWVCWLLLAALLLVAVILLMG